MATVFELRIDDDWVYNEIGDCFVDELEDRLGRRLDDNEFNDLCVSIADEMCAKPLGISQHVNATTRFSEWFVDVMPQTFNLVYSHLQDALDCYIEEKIKEIYGKEAE